MKRWFPLLLTVLFLVAPAWPAQATTTPAGDSVTSVSGATVTFPEALGPEFPLRYQNIVLNAHSDSSGGNVSGTVAFDAVITDANNPTRPPTLLFSLGGPVTCLAVHGNSAIIGFNDTAGFGPMSVRVVDNGSTGSPPDQFFADPIATDCTSVASTLHGGNLTSGNMVVHYVTPGTIVGTSFENCNTLHVVYNRFPNGTIVHWTVTTNSVGTVASGQFSAIGGGTLGSKTYHFLDIPLGTTLKQNFQSHVMFTWGVNGAYSASPNPIC